jgi:hypothetical protein
LAPIILLLVLALAYYLYRYCKVPAKKDDLNDGVEMWSNDPHHRLSGSGSTLDVPGQKPQHALSFGMKPSERIPGQKPEHALSFSMKPSERILGQKPQHALSFGMKQSMGNSKVDVAESPDDSDWKKLNDILDSQKPEHALSFNMKPSTGNSTMDVAESSSDSDWKKLNEKLDKQKPDHALSFRMEPLDDGDRIKPHHKLSVTNFVVPSDKPQLPSEPSVIRPAPPSPRLQQQLSVRSIGRIQSFALDNLHREIENEDTKHIDDLFDDDGEVDNEDLGEL